MPRISAALGRANSPITKEMHVIRFLGSLAIAIATLSSAALAGDAPIKVLFLGDRGHHQPAARFAQLEPVLAGRGIELVYTENLADLDPAVLAGYDALAVFANIESITPEQEAAIAAFVRGGKGLVPLHCASFCFQNSPLWIDLVGAQFQRHGAGDFATVIVAPEHPVMTGFGGFSSWDETYVHTKHNPRGRTVLEERVEGDHHEPWTWVRTEGNGRVFYTAWGHDQRTWGNPGFHNLVERGIRFAAGRDPAAAGPYVGHPTMTSIPEGLEPFEYQPAKVPFYIPKAEWGKMGEPITEMQKPLEPEESRKHAITPEGFAIDLVAAEPLFQAKPLAFAFDHDGGLYVSESVDYPNGIVLPGEGKGRDRIVRLDDTDGDGRFDRRTVFCEPLSICTSMLAHDGGLIVTQAPHTLYLKDTDGDGKADVRRQLFTGWGTYDTHAGPSNLTWGLDGQVYGIVGYSGFKGRVGDEDLEFKQGFFRFKPDGSRLEFLRSTNNNSWGFGFSEEGVLFGSTANGNPSEHMPLANRVYERVRGWNASTLGGISGSPAMEVAPRKGTPDGLAPVRQVDHHGHFTAAAGHRLYTARAYPPEYWNRTAFVCEPTGHVVATFELTPSGAAFRSRMAWSLVASDDEWTSPIQADVGPDGQVWVIDWYNFIVQHNPTPAGFENGKGNAYVTPLRDKVHGRLWRVVHEATAKEAHRTTLAGASPEELVAALRDSNMFWRERAQRKLVDRAAGRPDGGRDVMPALVKLVTDTSVDAIGLNPAAIHALWTLRQLGGIEGPAADPAVVTVVEQALRHPSAGVRMNAIRVLPRTAVSLAACEAAGLATDPAPLVRLWLLDALGEFPASEQAAAMAVAMLEDSRTLADPVLADAATSAAAIQAAGVLPALISGVLMQEAAAAAPPASPQRLALVERVAEHVARGGDAQTVAALVTRLTIAHPETAAAALTGLARGWPNGRPIEFDAAARAALGKLVAALPPAAQGQLITLVQRAGSDALDAQLETVTESLLAAVDDTAAADKDRIEAARRLVLLRPADPGVADELLERIDARTDPDFATGILSAVAQSTATESAAAVLEKAVLLPPTVREAAYREAVNNRTWARVLVERLEQGAIRLTDLALVERNRLAEHRDRGLRDRARKLIAAGGGLPDADRQKVIDEVLPVVLAGGDAVLGKAVFKEHCGKCHTHSGEGGKVGPELTGMSVHPPQELLIHILDPNRSVEGNYRAYTVATDAGHVVNGLLAGESKTAIELVDAEGKRHVIQRDEIDEFVPSTNSLMPVGFEKQIPAASLADLLAFLTARGKYVPLPLDKVATASSTKGMFYESKSETERLVFPDWSPKIVGGIPFVLVDPRGDTVPNVIMLYGPHGYLPPKMPRKVSVPLGSPAKAIHILGGVSGWGWPHSAKGSESLLVRLTYDDDTQEVHTLVNGEHLSDYIARNDVPGSEFAFDLGGRQIRHVVVVPKQRKSIKTIELAKGSDDTAPIVMAMTAEMP
jgi:putative membrane-bound dehydrogenase-like protein